MNVPRASMRPTTFAAAAAAALAACSLEETGANFISPNVFYQNDAQAASAVNGVYAPLMDWNGWKQPAQHSIMCDDDEMLCWNWMGGGGVPAGREGPARGGGPPPGLLCDGERPGPAAGRGGVGAPGEGLSAHRGG